MDKDRDREMRIAEEFFLQWNAFSKAALAILAPHCPMTPGDKVRPWDDGEGPNGLMVHYTGGPNGIASICWANENAENTGSSWHCTVLDCRLQEIEDIWNSFPMVVAYLPVTAILHAKLDMGTWHGNAGNKYCFGLENRNLGLLTESGGKIYRQAGSKRYYPKDGKEPVLVYGKWWEPYTQEQLIANINIGRMLKYWRGEKFIPNWVIPHQFIRGCKSDTGSAYPMIHVRNAIFNDVPIESIKWLKDYQNALVLPYPDDEDVLDYDEKRLDVDIGSGKEAIGKEILVEPQDFDKVHGESWRDYLPACRSNLTLLGGYCPDPGIDVAETDLDKDLQIAVTQFQTSTWDPKYSGKKLTVDGIPGSSTREEIERRLRFFGHNV